MGVGMGRAIPVQRTCRRRGVALGSRCPVALGSRCPVALGSRCHAALGDRRATMGRVKCNGGVGWKAGRVTRAEIVGAASFRT